MSCMQFPPPTRPPKKESAVDKSKKEKRKRKRRTVEREKGKGRENKSCNMPWSSQSLVAKKERKKGSIIIVIIFSVRVRLLCRKSPATIKTQKQQTKKTQDETARLKRSIHCCCCCCSFACCPLAARASHLPWTMALGAQETTACLTEAQGPQATVPACRASSAAC